MSTGDMTFARIDPRQHMLLDISKILGVERFSERLNQKRTLCIDATKKLTISNTYFKIQRVCCKAFISRTWRDRLNSLEPSDG
jgi:hypothetical protein